MNEQKATPPLGSSHARRDCVGRRADLTENATPRVGAMLADMAVGKGTFVYAKLFWELADLCRQLERELAVAQQEVAALKVERDGSDHTACHKCGMYAHCEDCVCATAPEPAEQSCPACGGNDKSRPCAYPSGNQPGCLRDKRLAESAAPALLTDEQVNSFEAALSDLAPATKLLASWVCAQAKLARHSPVACRLWWTK
jgi:hypothetical protein